MRQPYRPDLPVELPDAYLLPECRARIELVAESHARLIGRPLVAQADDMVTALWHAPFAILAHGTGNDPEFFFGNRAALAAFETIVGNFIGMPSRLSAEAPWRAERQALLDRVSANGFIDDYSGIRISASGRRFRIEHAVVWNLIDGTGALHGQAATFAI
ncbi:MAG: MEKHLA domain-containing protein [Novosphingobium sp.]